MTARERPRGYWRAVAKRNGISRTCFANRIRRGWNPETAATTPPNPMKPKDPEMVAKSRAYGLGWDAIYRWRRNNPDRAASMTDDEIAQYLRDYHNGSTASLARAAGQSPERVRNRLRAGWTMEDALSTPPLPRGETFTCTRGRR